MNITSEELKVVVQMCDAVEKIGAGGPDRAWAALRKLAQSELDRRENAVGNLAAEKLQMLLERFGPVRNDADASHIVNEAIVALTQRRAEPVAEVPNTMSRDYDELYRRVMAGDIALALVDYNFQGSSTIFRDVCKIQKRGEEISLFARGIGYGDCGPFYSELSKMSEQEFFRKMCTAMNVEWIIPSPPTANQTTEPVAQTASDVQLKFHAIGDRPLVEVISRGEQTAPEPMAQGVKECAKCEGTGLLPTPSGKAARCPECHGNGKFWPQQAAPERAKCDCLDKRNMVGDTVCNTYRKCSGYFCRHSGDHCGNCGHDLACHNAAKQQEQKDG